MGGGMLDVTGDCGSGETKAVLILHGFSCDLRVSYDNFLH